MFHILPCFIHPAPKNTSMAVANSYGRPVGLPGVSEIQVDYKYCPFEQQKDACLSVTMNDLTVIKKGDQRVAPTSTIPRERRSPDRPAMV